MDKGIKRGLIGAWLATVMVVAGTVMLTFPKTDVHNFLYPQRATVTVTDEDTGKSATLECSTIDKGGRYQAMVEIVEGNFQMYDCAKVSN